jgi:hypothetical protein
VVSTAGAVGLTGGFLLARHSNYRPLPFRDVLAQMEKELHLRNQTVTRTVSRDGKTILSSAAQQLDPRPPASAPAVQGWLHAMRTRTTLLLHAARVPARFYAVNVLGGAIIAGCATSVAQRVVCGRTGHPSELGRSLVTKSLGAARPAAPAPAPVIIVVNEEPHQPPPAFVLSHTGAAAASQDSQSPRA